LILSIRSKQIKPYHNLAPPSIANLFVEFSRISLVNVMEMVNDGTTDTQAEAGNQQKKRSLPEGQEFYEADTVHPRMLHNWALYDCDTRLIPLELLPMKPHDNIDVTIFGSGAVVFNDDGNWDCLVDSDTPNPVGTPTFLSPIKEWMIEYGGYRLGRPSKQYAPWHESVLKTARVAISILRLLEEQTRLAKLFFQHAIKRLSEAEKNDEAFISSDPSDVERYLVAHGQVILQMFSAYPKKHIVKCSFATDLARKLEERQHTRWVIKKNEASQKNRYQKKDNLLPRAGMPPAAKNKSAMQATTTRLINRIWGEFYFSDSPEVPLQETSAENGEEASEEEGENVEGDAEDTEEEPEETVPEPVEVQKPHTPPKELRGSSSEMGIRWDGEVLGYTSAGERFYRQALVLGETVAVGGAFVLEVDETQAIYFVEYMFESRDHCKCLHGRLLQRGSETVLKNAANERELFLTNECITVQLKDIKGTVPFEIRSRPWGHPYRKENNTADKLDRAKAEKRKAKGLPTEYFCKSLYSPERGGFFTLPLSDMGLGSGSCNSCRIREDEKERSKIKLNDSRTGFSSNGSEYISGDYVYVNPQIMIQDGLKVKGKFKGGRNIGLDAFVVCQFLGIYIPTQSNRNGSFGVYVRRFYRPEDISAEKAYTSDIQEVYYSQELYLLPPKAIEGKCEVREKKDMPLPREFPISENIFFCEHLYGSSTGCLNQFWFPFSDTLLRKQKGKELESEADSGTVKRLATLDIFAGCGGLTHGLDRAGATETKWAIEFEETAGEAFKINHPKTTVFVDNCNVILRAVMERCGDQDECISTTEANELAAKLDEEQKRTLPLPGQVDFISGGPPCQGFSKLNRFNQGIKSKVGRQMILAFLSFADYFRPRYFLLENVRNFVSYNEGHTFRLTLASLLEMGYQVRFGILEAGAYGLAQSRKRAFVWAAAPEEVLPEWPEPMHVFCSPELKISLNEGLRYAAVRSTRSGAPFRSLTVRDAIGDLPRVKNGASKIKKKYRRNPVSWFQKEVRGNKVVLRDHICKEMNEQNLTRCKKIPKRPGADWRDLPDEKLMLKDGTWVDLIPHSLKNKAKTHNGWKGLYGRLDWQGNFPTSITDPQPTGIVGMCFHPDQDRIVTVRECARSQGFPDSYKFAGGIKDKHRQIGNAVPPPLAFALGRKLKEALHLKQPLQHQT
ncbi:unnamed protein product, partial [Thlaspi arvense]